jgi:hypothetical protein
MRRHKSISHLNIRLILVQQNLITRGARPRGLVHQLDFLFYEVGNQIRVAIRNSRLN